jgi:mRNA interferase RelE/StbE
MALIKAWSLVFDSRFDKKFDRLSHNDQKRIMSFFENRVLKHPNPKEYAKPLKGDLAGYWSFRIGRYRVIADIIDEQLKIITFDVGHRREIYD